MARDGITQLFALYLIQDRVEMPHRVVRANFSCLLVENVSGIKLWHNTVDCDGRFTLTINYGPVNVRPSAVSRQWRIMDIDELAGPDDAFIQNSIVG